MKAAVLLPYEPSKHLDKKKVALMENCPELASLNQVIGMIIWDDSGFLDRDIFHCEFKLKP